MNGFEKINEENFNQEVLQSSTPVLLEFGGAWCKPCKTLEPLLLKLAQEWNGKVKLAKLDVDECPNLTIQFQVMSLPTTILFIDGKVREFIIGLKSGDSIREKIQPNL